MQISIFGIGYVGAVVGACLAESRSVSKVILVDTDPIKVKCIQKGRSPIVEKGLSDLIAKNVESTRLSATTDATFAVMNSEVTMICVGTPSDVDGALNLTYIKAACKQIGKVLKDKTTFHSVILRSTVVPGSAREIAIPALEKASKKIAGIDFGFGNNPEFLREGTAIDDYFHPPKVVIGAIDKSTEEILLNLYEDIVAPKITTEINVAEGVKFVDNAWHAQKVTFANEMGNILKVLGVDSHEVMDIFCQDTKLNIASTYLKPGFAFGGSCLPKDVKAFSASAKRKGIATPLCDAILTANELQIQKAFQMILETGKKKIGMLGLSFKAGTDDLRESPLVKLADLMLKNGLELAIYDPNVYRASCEEGASGTYIREHIAHISKSLVETSEPFLADSELLVIGNHGEDFADILKSAQEEQLIIDLVRLKDNAAESHSKYEGICW